MEHKRGWHGRGYLPHFDGEVIQFVTFRLYDALPAGILKALRIERDAGKLERFYNEEARERIEEYLDSGSGQCFLKDPRIADIVQNALLHQAEKLFHLFAWVIMPNHVHILVKPSADTSLSFIMKGLKGYTSNQANKALNRSGQFWQPDYFDRYIRDRDHYLSTVDYIENNPVKAGLCLTASDWDFSSAGNRARSGTSLAGGAD